MASEGYLLGFDMGSSSIKAALIDIATGQAAGEATSPKTELAIASPQPGWAEQEPRPPSCAPRPAAPSIP